MVSVRFEGEVRELAMQPADGQSCGSLPKTALPLETWTGWDGWMDGWVGSLRYGSDGPGTQAQSTPVDSAPAMEPQDVGGFGGRLGLHCAKVGALDCYAHCQ